MQITGMRLLLLVRFWAFVIISLLLYSSSVNGQERSVYKIYLKGKTLNTSNNLDAWVSETHKYPQQVILQFGKLPGKAEKEALLQYGLQLKDYLPDNGYTAVLYKKVSKEVLQISGAHFIMEMPSYYKLANDIPVTKKGNLQLCISLYSSFNRTNIAQTLQQYKATILKDRYESLGYVDISLPSYMLSRLSEWYLVKYISLSKEDHPLNADAKAITGTRIASTPVIYGGYGLNGEGTAVGVGDNTSGIYHIDMVDRVLNYTPNGYTNHGVHINGIVGGAGVVDPSGEGMATKTKLADFYFSDILNATPDIRSKFNVNITNNSYSATRGSCDYAGTYDQLSEGLDGLCKSYPDVLHVFAAANDGKFDCPPYPTGFATIAGGYQAAKNVLVVTSTDKTYENAVDASRGPVKDGRLKPEISAVGVQVKSTTKVDSYLVSGGTSMACPNVAGATALLTERYKQIKGGGLPRADVLKALLINGATDIGNKGPDYRYGFGFLNLKRSLIMLDSNRIITGSVNDGDSKTQTVVVPPNTSQLKVTISWLDVPASPMAQKQLVNDIDMTVSQPGSQLHLPLVLNPDPDKINDLAVEKEDRLNNTEQVVVYNPVPGNYNITIKGFNIPSGNQEYAIAYDFVPIGLSFKYPLTGSTIKNDDTLHVYWDASESGGSFTLEYTDDNGTNWKLIDNNIPEERLYYKWGVPANINSGECKMRLTRNGTGMVAETGPFIINTQPEVSLGLVQCPGYINMEWNAIPNVTYYEVMRKYGPEMSLVDTTSATNYVFKGLALDSLYYVSVRPVIGGLSGYRALAVKRRPVDGNCQGTISDGDVMLEEILAPTTGRRFTSTALTANETLSLSIRNLDDNSCDSYKVSYDVNSQGWVSQVINSPLSANSINKVDLIGLNLSAIGEYTIVAAIENLSQNDPVDINDTIITTIKHLANAPVTLSYDQDFEAFPELVLGDDSSGIGDMGRWDYKNATDTGRLRTHVRDNVTISGARSLSMDIDIPSKQVQNQFQGTFNMSNYNIVDDEVRLEFDYIVHGVPKTKFGNQVWARGADTDSYGELYFYEAERATVGQVLSSGSLSLNDLLLSDGSAFTASTQVNFAQNDTSVIASRRYGSGVTFDNIKLYIVENDLQLLEVISPEPYACGRTGAQPLIVNIRNGVSKTLNNIKLNYKLNNGEIIIEEIASISGKQSLEYTFSKTLDLSAFGDHIIDIWVEAGGDTYNKNDSILQYVVRNQPLVTQFPYKEEFEDNDGYWYSEGINNSWEYGIPTARGISDAASGTKAWVTNLDGLYNANERSYLYSPCFDISELINPVLSFKAALDIENCGQVLCDAAYIEFTKDGDNWERLLTDNGTNWYNDTSYEAWTIENKTIWHPVSVPLPDTVQSLQFRAVLNTDPGSEHEGIGIDDVEVYDEKFYEGDNSIITLGPNPNTDGNISIEWAANEGTEMKVVMSDISGHSVYKSSYTAQQGYNKTILSTPVFSSGVYILNIQIGDRDHVRKIVYVRQ